MTGGRVRVVLAILTALVLSGCADDGVKRDDAGEVIEEGKVGVFQIEVGDCLDDPPGAGAEVDELDQLAALPCSEPHDNEVFALIELDGDADAPYPGVERVIDAGADRCLGAFEDYVEAAYETSELDFAVYLFPTEATWTDLDDREVVCALFAADRSKLTGSMEGTGR